MVLSIAAGYSTSYLQKEVAEALEAATGSASAGERTASAYYTGSAASGEPAGMWWGAGAESLGLSGVIDGELLSAVFDHRLDPRDPASRSTSTWGESAALVGQRRPRHVQVAAAYRALLAEHPGAGPEQRAALRVEADQRVARSKSVAFFDATYSPPKSVTVVWAAAERAAAEHSAAADVARAAGDLTRAAGETAQARVWHGRADGIEAAVMAGHAAALGYLQDHHTFVRTGHHGMDKRTGESTGKWIDGKGLVAGQFLQHDSRARDPQLHVHGPVNNAVEGADGKWRTLDSRAFHAGKRAASSVADRVTEAELEKLGLRCETRADGKAREIVGVSQDSIDVFSSRRRAIVPAAARLIAEFTDREGREPTGPERSELSQIATLATRPAKGTHAEDETAVLDRWADRHQAEVGATLREAADTAFASGRGAPAAWSERDVIEAALAAVAEDHQSWTRTELIGKLSDALPGGLGIPAREVRPLLEGLADIALAEAVRLSPEQDTGDLPAALRRSDGSSVYANPAPPRYAARGQLLADAALREAAIERGAATVSPARVQTLLAEYAAAGKPLSVDQEAALRGICSSGAKLEVLSAPAGTGKSFLDGVLVRAWEGTGQVRGVTFGQRQAEVLTEEGVTSRNIAAWLSGQERLAQGRPVGDDEKFRLSRGDLLIVDEAQMAGTNRLAHIAELTHRAGAKLLLTGDPAQGGLGQSGTLADLAARASTHELFEVRRFSAEWERGASLRLRDGDTSALTDYDQHGRIIDGGAREQAEQLAGRAWLADTLQGRESLVVVPTNEQADRICGQLRVELVRLGLVEETGVRLGMQDTTAGVGDLIQARHADPRRALVNRTVFRVQEVRSDGSLLAAQVRYDRDDGERLDAPRIIPADYVASHVALGYASTKDAAIGRTTDTAHSLITKNLSRAAAYVPLTRGRDGNWAYVVTQETGEDTAPGETAQTARRDPVGVLHDILTRPPEAADLTALAQLEQTQQAGRELPAALHPLMSTLSDLAEARTAQLLDQMLAQEIITSADRAAFAADPATDSLTQLLRRAELAGHEPEQLLTTVLGARDLTGAQSVAQVTHNRITKAVGALPSPAITSFQDLIPTDVPTSYRPVLQRWADQADERRAELGADAARLPEADRPAWLATLGPLPSDPMGRVEWETRAGWAASWREMEAAIEPLAETDPVGAAPGAGLVDRRAVWQTAHDALGLGDGGTAEGEMTDGQLRARVRAYERERVWAPRYVGDELAGTHEALRRAEEDATIWRARAVTEADPTERDLLLAAAQGADGTAEQARERLPELEAIDIMRGGWFAHTAVTRENAGRAEAELEIRGIDRAAEPKVTAREWLDAHLADQADDEATREVREVDIDDRPEDAVLVLGQPPAEAAPGAGQAAVTAPPDDIRETAQLDPAELAPEAAPRRMPPADETAAALTRARDAAREIATRTGWEQEQEEEPDTDPQDPGRARREADDQRAEQLNGWADDGHRAGQHAMATADARAGHADNDGDGDGDG